MKTILKLMVTYMCCVFVAIIFIACKSQKPPVTAEKPPNRFMIYERNSSDSFFPICTYEIIDPQTSKKYLVVRQGESVAVTPLLEGEKK